MKLIKVPLGLPISSLKHVTGLLASFIVLLQNEQELFGTATSHEDYMETIDYLYDDLNGYTETYEDWMLQAKTEEQKIGLTYMHEYIEKAQILLSKAGKVHSH